jgi:integrase
VSISTKLPKNESSREVHLNENQIEALRVLPVRTDDRLFPFQDAYALARPFRHVVKRAGIENFRLHDLRKTFAGRQAMAGTVGRGLQELLGRKDGRMTARYIHLSGTYLKAAVEGVNLGANLALIGTGFEIIQ